MIFSTTQHINGYFPKKSLSRCCLLPAWEQGPAFGRFWKKNSLRPRGFFDLRSSYRENRFKLNFVLMVLDKSRSQYERIWKEFDQTHYDVRFVLFGFIFGER
jgi:hypothetical protein